MANKQTKVILTGNYDARQIRALLTNFVLTNEAQVGNKNVCNATDIEIITHDIKQTAETEFEVTIDWKEKKKNYR